MTQIVVRLKPLERRAWVCSASQLWTQRNAGSRSGISTEISTLRLRKFQIWPGTLRSSATAEPSSISVRPPEKNGFWWRPSKSSCIVHREGLALGVDWSREIMPFRAGTSGPASNSPLPGADSSNVRERALIRTFYLGRQGFLDQRIFKPPEIPSEPAVAVALRASVRHHRRALRGYLWAHVGWIGFHPAAPCSPLNDCHPRPVNAYVRLLSLPPFWGLSGRSWARGEGGPGQR